MTGFAQISDECDGGPSIGSYVHVDTSFQQARTDVHPRFWGGSVWDCMPCARGPVNTRPSTACIEVAPRDSESCVPLENLSPCRFFLFLLLAGRRMAPALQSKEGV